jgi:hypothetical protein
MILLDTLFLLQTKLGLKKEMQQHDQRSAASARALPQMWTGRQNFSTKISGESAFQPMITKKMPTYARCPAQVCLRRRLTTALQFSKMGILM